VPATKTVTAQMLAVIAVAVAFFSGSPGLTGEQVRQDPATRSKTGAWTTPRASPMAPTGRPDGMAVVGRGFCYRRRWRRR